MRLVCTLQSSLKDESVLLYSLLLSHFHHPLLLETGPELPDSPGTSRHVLKWFTGQRKLQAHKRFAEEHGCLPAPRIQNQRPWGVDRLEQIFRGDRESRLMELFMFHFRQTGNTVEQFFIRTIAFDTIEPANVEALLSTNFKGIVPMNVQ